jgi:hypothetical protein
LPAKAGNDGYAETLAASRKKKKEKIISKVKIKENITQVILIIVSILIAFGIDRAYDSYKLSLREKSFIKDQILQVEQENKILTQRIESNKELRDKTEKGLKFIENVDSLIEYTQWLGNMSYFNPEISSLSVLNDIYGIKDFINFGLKKEFQKLYWEYANIEFYENEYSLELKNNYTIFWRKNYNAFHKSYVKKENFQSDEYLNTVKRSLNILDQRIESYNSAKEAQELLIKKLKEASR